MMTIMKRTSTWLFVAALLLGFALAQDPALRAPDPLPANPTPAQLHATILEVHDSLCRDIEYAASILTETGTLSQAIPVVIEITGMQPAEIEQMEAEVCRSDASEWSLEELRSANRKAVWLVEVHLAAMSEVLGAP